MSKSKIKAVPTIHPKPDPKQEAIDLITSGSSFVAIVFSQKGPILAFNQIGTFELSYSKDILSEWFDRRMKKWTSPEEQISK